VDNNISLPNLNVLDLSHNLLTFFHFEVLLNMPHLRTLILAGNPMERIQTSSTFSHRYMRVLDISHTARPMGAMNTTTLRVFPELGTLNFSHSGITYLTGEGLHVMPKLKAVDFSGCSVSSLPAKFMREFTRLGVVVTGDYRLCCPQLLPPAFNAKNCLSPQSLLSSCDSLLGSLLHRVAVAVLASLAVSCNLIKTAWSALALHKSSATLAKPVEIFLTNLSMSDLMVGICLAIVGVADRVYDGIYYMQQTHWQHSALCAAVGFMFIAAHNVSVGVLFCLTLERCVLLHPCCERRRFSLKSSKCVCAMAWVIGITLAAVPLVNATSHWRLYSRSGLCVPLPVSALHTTPGGHVFSLTATVIAPGAILLLVLAGYAFLLKTLPSSYDCITSSVDTATNSSNTTTTPNPDTLSFPSSSPSHALPTRSSRNSMNTYSLQQASQTRCLLPTISTAVVLWLPVCVWVVLQDAASHSHKLRMSDPSHVTLLLVTLPLRSALSPLLYWLGVVQERRRQEHRVRLMKWMGVKPKPAKKR
jgi:hypothetical protein